VAGLDENPMRSLSSVLISLSRRIATVVVRGGRRGRLEEVERQ
jgi:hypothetical protein